MHIPKYISGIRWVHKDPGGVIRVLIIPEGFQDRLNPDRAVTVSTHQTFGSFLEDDYVQLECQYDPRNLLADRDYHPYREEVLSCIGAKNIPYKAFMLTSVPTLGMKPEEIRVACEEKRKFTCTVRVWL